MYKVGKRFTTQKPPAGWDKIAPILEEIDRQMEDAVNESHEGKRVRETLHPIHKYHFYRTRFIYEAYYKKKAISRELYEYCLREKLADAKLIAKWKKPGYNNLCSLMALEKNHFGSVSICRVPRHERGNREIENVKTGCRGCAGSEVPYGWHSDLFPLPGENKGKETSSGKKRSRTEAEERSSSRDRSDEDEEQSNNRDSEEEEEEERDSRKGKKQREKEEAEEEEEEDEDEEKEEEEQEDDERNQKEEDERERKEKRRRSG
ncbi:G10 protein [Balamuthia mandrillaris]